MARWAPCSSAYKLSEADYRGERFRDWKGKHLKGAHELLLLTHPEAIERVHEEYLQAGADVLETNTFSATTIGQHDFLFRRDAASGRKDPEFFERVVNDPDLRAIVARDERRGGAARAAGHREGRADSRRFVAGSLGPLPVTASLSPDVNDPGFRAVTFDQIRRSYRDQVDGLLEGGVDLLLVETVFDTLNAKAALFAIADAFEERGRSVPLIVSGTVTDRSGRTLSGQTVEAFLNSTAHARPLVVGLNCALGPDEMAPFLEELAHSASTFVSAYPNAGLPDPLSETGFPETPESFAPQGHRVGAQWLAQPGRRLLRHDAGAHREICRCGPRTAAAATANVGGAFAPRWRRDQGSGAPRPLPHCVCPDSSR